METGGRVCTASPRKWPSSIEPTDTEIPNLSWVWRDSWRKTKGRKPDECLRILQSDCSILSSFFAIYVSLMEEGCAYFQRSFFGVVLTVL
jgi:hypothetical protein